MTPPLLISTPEVIKDTPSKIRPDESFRNLVQCLRNGRTNWAAFDRARILRALGPVVGKGVPVLPDPLTTHPRPTIQVLAPASSSSASTSATMSRRSTFRRANQTPSESSRRVRAGEISAALLDVQTQGVPNPALPLLGAGAMAAPSVPALVPEGNAALNPPNAIAVSSNESGENSNAHPPKRPRMGVSPPHLVDEPSVRQGNELLGRQVYETRPQVSNEARSGGARGNSNSSGATSGRAYRWRFEHTRAGPVTNDPASMATLARHFKSAGCQIPAVRNMACRDEYTDMAEAYGLLMAGVNRLVSSYEKKLADGPRSEELDEMTSVIANLNNTVNIMRTREAQDAERLESIDVLRAQATRAEIDRDDLKEKFRIATDQLFTLQTEKANLESQVRLLSEEKLSLQSAWDDELRKAVKTGKRELAAHYLAALDQVKEKFEKKKAEADKEIQLQEVEANLELLDLMVKKEITDLDAEIAKLKELKGQFEIEFVGAQVSDFSLRRLALPQISEDSVIMKDAETGAHRVTNQYSSNEVAEDDGTVARG